MMAGFNFKVDTRICDEDRAVLRDFCSELGGDVAVLAKRLGLAVYSMALPDSVSGYIDHAPSKGTKSGYIVVVNSKHNIERQKFTAAHEIGHYVLHRNSKHFKKMESQSAEVLNFPSGYRSMDSWDFIAGLEFPELYEKEVDAFAATVLLPSHLLRVTPEFESGEPAKLARRLRLSTSMVVRRFEDEMFR